MRTRNIAGIEYFRVILCIGIIIFHAGIPGSELFWIGIEGFFVLSSFFLVKGIYEKGNEPVKLVYKRIKRLYLPYLLLIIWAIIWAIINGKGFISIVEDVIRHLVFMQNFAWMREGYVTALCYMTMHTWTMSIEICLYIFMVFVLKVIRKELRNWKRLFVSTIVVVALCRMGLYIAGMENVITFFPLMHLDAYAIGGLVAVVYLEDKKKMTQYAVSLGSIGMLAILGCIIMTMSMRRCGLFAAYVIYAGSEGYLSNIILVQIYLYAAVLWGGVLSWILKVQEGHNVVCYKCIEYLGKNSYDIYIFHWPISYIILKPMVLNPYMKFICTMGGTLLIVAILNLLRKARCLWTKQSFG